MLDELILRHHIFFILFYFLLEKNIPVQKLSQNHGDAFLSNKTEQNSLIGDIQATVGERTRVRNRIGKKIIDKKISLEVSFSYESQNKNDPFKRNAKKKKSAHSRVQKKKKNIAEVRLPSTMPLCHLV